MCGYDNVNRQTDKQTRVSSRHLAAGSCPVCEVAGVAGVAGVEVDCCRLESV